MNLAILRSWSDPLARWEKVALLVWFAILAFVSVRVFVSPEARPFTHLQLVAVSGGKGPIFIGHRPKARRIVPWCGSLPFALLPVPSAAWRGGFSIWGACSWHRAGWHMPVSIRCRRNTSHGCSFYWRALFAERQQRPGESARRCRHARRVAWSGGAQVKCVLWHCVRRDSIRWRLHGLACALSAASVVAVALTAADLLLAFLFQAGYVIDHAKWIPGAKDRSATLVEHMYAIFGC